MRRYIIKLLLLLAVNNSNVFVSSISANNNLIKECSFEDKTIHHNENILSFIEDQYFVKQTDFTKNKYGCFVYFAKREGDYQRICFKKDSLYLYGDEETFMYRIEKSLADDILTIRMFYENFNGNEVELAQSLRISSIDIEMSSIKIEWTPDQAENFPVISSGEFISISSFDSLYVEDMAEGQEDGFEFLEEDLDNTAYLSYFKINGQYCYKVYCADRILQPHEQPTENTPKTVNTYKNNPIIILDIVKVIQSPQEESYWIKAYMHYYGESFFFVKKDELKKLDFCREK